MVEEMVNQCPREWRILVSAEEIEQETRKLALERKSEEKSKTKEKNRIKGTR